MYVAARGFPPAPNFTGDAAAAKFADIVLSWLGEGTLVDELRIGVMETAMGIMLRIGVQGDARKRLRCRRSRMEDVEMKRDEMKCKGYR